jgi:hypothetical protein
MAANENLVRAEDITMAAPIGANNGVGPISGDPLLYGRGTSPNFALACVAETSYTPPTGVATGNISVKFIGAFLLSVVGKTSASGSSAAIKIGDRVFADTNGTYDATTGCYYGFTLCNNTSTGIYFGNALDAVAGNATTTIRVRLKVAG